MTEKLITHLLSQLPSMSRTSAPAGAVTHTITVVHMITMTIHGNIIYSDDERQIELVERAVEKNDAFSMKFAS